MAYTLGRFTVDDVGFIQVVPARILVAAAKGDLDLNLLAREELANRGLDQAGVWVGFERAIVALRKCGDTVRTAPPPHSSPAEE
ncbi:MAG: hypothetical protein BGO63_06825 [Candidatus Accumulibacter sp. 66-26]|mgnify:CR=1 FL=1|nr:hypothetical protein [Accumulibacter sp.]OJW47144.1 MAG: hypothetical protein BGO63_06825 [Candidatus Accumulibacter sp. 66-26]